ncbi:MAG: hypothetical protein Pg6C_19060 [Treponemataceae bacterium]|nr:MAG: hypothetical protein Pg6C_18650 [Treponemataceae bacterium]GMO53008.1 MAG: hypothetical protein Pg6C_19060 [Treponemataceae bacterium]
MSKLHIIGVGGTGHKIVNAAIHLAACGAFKGNLGKHEIKQISVLTIDADDSNGNLALAKQTLSAYRDYYAEVSGAGEFGLVPIEPVSEKVNIPLFKEDKKSLNTTFNVPQYDGKDADKFIRFLYTKEEIEEEFDQGFYGHTSIGTLIINDILRSSSEWEKQISQINEDDFVVVAGSIFGGTGASAIPVLLDKLSAQKRQTNFRLAALVLNPYFRTAGDFAENGLLRPDAANFNIKAKSSLYYYYGLYQKPEYNKPDAFYIIGEPEQNYSVEIASRGASSQRNKAAPIELFAATAFIDFVRESKNRGDGGIITAQRAYGNNNEYLYTWQMLQEILPDLPANIQTALKTAIFYNKVLYPHLEHDTDPSGALKKFYIDLDKRKDDKQNFIYENIHEYLTLLVRWFFDIHRRNRKEINQNTGRLGQDADSRVQLFNANNEKLFDGRPVPDAKIENFENLVYHDAYGKKSEKIYALFAARPSAKDSNKDFAALFSVIYSLMGEQKKSFLGFGKKAPEAESFTSVPYLSKENNVSFVIPANPGELWAKSQPTLLSQIADGLPVSVSESFTKNDISIPSPWSIFITNELTLTEPKFAAINKTAFNEWCGIIALLVLRKLNRYENQGLKLEALELVGGDGEFLLVVNETLRPESRIFDNPVWIKTYRLSLDGVTIAFLAHNTLVCSAYSLDIVTKGKLNKIAPTVVNENGEFLPPDNYFKDQSQSLNRDAKYALKLFLIEFKAIITREAARNKGGIIKKLQDLTDKYLAALGNVTPNANLSIEPEKKNAVHSVVQLFEDLILAPGATGSEELPFIIEGARISAALIGLNICGISSSSAEAANILVTPNLLYNQITPANIGEYRNTARDGIKLFYADELLCDSMILIKKEGGFVFHAMPNDSSLPDSEIIWPLNYALLDELYSADSLNTMVSFTAGRDKIVVSLKIRLNGKLGAHTVRKEYCIKNSSDNVTGGREANGICWIMEKNLIPFWSLWPYAKINDANGNNTWQRYNCFCVEPNYRGIPVLDIKPVFNGDANYLAGERKLSTLQTVVHEFYYRRYTALPAAFKVYEKTDNAPVYRGMVFLDTPKTVNAGAIRWNVGVDFGTTSTTAFYTSTGGAAPKFIQLMTEYQWREGNAAPKKSEYNNDLVTICDSGDKSSEIYFIDRQCFKQNGYATALEIMDTSSGSADATIFSGERIFWHNYENFRIMNTQKSRKERLLTNIKWESNKSNSAKYLNQLLTQIVYHAAEKGVRCINFSFSYPTAFGPGAKDDFCERVSGIMKLLSEETGLVLTFDDKHNLLTESIAAAYYFNHKKPRLTVFFCVDIGGGSTDASIWVKTKHLFQTSIHFASRDMFIRPLSRLVHIPSVLKAVTTDNDADGINMMLFDVSTGAGLTEDKFKFLIETVLFEYYEPLRNRLQNLEGHDLEAFKVFKYCVLVTYSGLMYYLANILASLFTTEDEDRRIDNDVTEIILGLSGKGSKLTDWIKSYCDIIYDEADNLIKEKTSLDVKILLEFSPETAKTETAIGMICDLDGDGKPKTKIDITKADVYIGCDITAAKGSEKKTLRRGDFADVYNDQFFSSPKEIKIEFDRELGELDSFIAFF